jgi:hypothetical protein
MDFHIIPECYLDTNLIETLVPPEGDGYNHQMGCPNVAKKMTEGKALKDGFALGIIDKDKKKWLTPKILTSSLIQDNSFC